MRELVVDSCAFADIKEQGGRGRLDATYRWEPANEGVTGEKWEEGSVSSTHTHPPPAILTLFTYAACLSTGVSFVPVCVCACMCNVCGCMCICSVCACVCVAILVHS